MLQLSLVGSSKPPIWLVDEKYSIGSSESSDLIVGGAGVDAHSADIIVTDDALSIVRIAADVHINVNGESIMESAVLSHGDKIHLGTAELRVLDPKKIQKQAGVASISEDGPEWSIQAQNAALSHRRFTILGSAILGRSKECDICLALSHLSRKHAQLTVTAEGLEVEDLGSSNGTYVNGTKVNKYVLQPGDELSFDNLKFRIACSDEDSDKTSIRPALSDTQFPPKARPTSNKTPAPQPSRKVQTSIAPKEEPISANVVNDPNKSQWVVLIIVVIALTGMAGFWLTR